MIGEKLEPALGAAQLEWRRPELRQRLQVRRALIAESVHKLKRTAGTTIDPQWAGAVPLALDDGFRLHRLIDPQREPADSFFQAVAELQRLLQR